MKALYKLLKLHGLPKEEQMKIIDKHILEIKHCMDGTTEKTLLARRIEMCQHLKENLSKGD